VGVAGTVSSGITNSLAATLGGSHGHSSDPSALMMSNAAATIAAVAAQAVQQIASQQHQLPVSTPHSTPFSAASLFAALQGNRNALMPGPQSAPEVAAPVASHAALMAAVANATKQSNLSGIGPLSGHDSTSTVASSMLHPSSRAVLPQHSSANAFTTPAMISTMQSWTVEQLENHVSLLQRMNQPVPQTVALLLSEARRKEKKKNAKRVANRKSASTSRARKKALVEEMTKANARLKRQAMILALLPDLVITTTPEGEITFCSAQVERILNYRAEDLVGAMLYNLVVPSSREALSCLIEELTHPGKAKAARASAKARRGGEKKRRIDDQRMSSDETGTSKNTEENNNENGNASVRDSSGTGGNSSGGTSGAAIVSEQSFPLSVVEVESKQRGKPKASATNENLDTSASNSGASGEDDAGAGTDRKKSESKKRPRSDDSSSLSSDAKNLLASDNLDRNVRWHNQRMLEGSKTNSPDDGPKDDVTGASVTANNASARLSSLKHVPDLSQENKKDDKGSRCESTGDQSSSDDSLLAGVEEKKKGENASDDSGYRESNDSREETSSSGSDTSQSNDRRKKPLAPACRMCLIRDDLTTIWCEVTSSIRNRLVDEEPAEETKGSETLGTKHRQKELLLCLRPIRDGEKKVNESLRFKPVTEDESLPAAKLLQEAMVLTSGADTNQDKAKSDKNSSAASQQNRGPAKKRAFASSTDAFSTGDELASKEKRAKTSGTGQSSTNASDTEKSVVESLMLMNKSS